MTLSREARAALQAAGQEHALVRLDQLKGQEALELESQLASLVNAEAQAAKAKIQAEPAALGRPEPPDTFPLERSPAQAEEAQAASAHGVQLLEQGKVAFVLVAGGQASRLGYDAPKGAYPIGPVTGRSLFAIHAARLQAARRKYGRAMPWYVMTSPGNDLATREYFQQHDHFGLPVEDITFFSQKMQPALDDQGRVLFATRSSLFLAPNGHGGCLLALHSSGALADMRARGIEQVSYFQVDNPLVRPTDPLFLGLHALAQAGMSSKIVPKRSASEKVGVLGSVDGKLQCIEYSDMTTEELESTNEDGQLTFNAGNIAVHLFALDFLDQVAPGGEALPWHVAAKEMQVIDEHGARVSTPGFKFETFVFDALAQSKHSITLEVDRAQESAPVKNKEGEDSPLSSRRALGQLFGGWLEQAGLNVPQALSDGCLPLEVAPELAEDAAEFRAALPLEPRVSPEGHFYGP